MTYQEKHNELQKLFSEKFDIYEKFQRELSLGKGESVEFLMAKSEFDKGSNDFQTFLILSKENNASPNDEFGIIGQRWI